MRLPSSAVILGTGLRPARIPDGNCNYLPAIRPRIGRPRLYPKAKADRDDKTSRVLHSCVSEKKVLEALHNPFESQTPGSLERHYLSSSAQFCSTRPDRKNTRLHSVRIEFWNLRIVCSEDRIRCPWTWIPTFDRNSGLGCRKNTVERACGYHYRFFRG